MTNLVSFDQVVKTFSVKTGDVEVLKDISFTIPKGSFTILFGPSGSGKSTILNTILGLEPPTSGTVSVNDVDLYSLTSDQRAKFRTHFVGMVTQDNYWVNSLSVIDNVALPLYLSGTSRSKARKQAKRSVERVHLERYLNSQPTVLSGGEEVLDLLLNQVNDGNSTVVMVTHNPDFLKFSNNILHIRDGIVTQENSFTGDDDEE